MTVKTRMITAGTFREMVSLFDLSSIQTSAQLITEMRTNPEVNLFLRYYCANYVLHAFESGEDVIYVGCNEGCGAVNPVFNNLEEAVVQLTTTRYYVPSQKDAEAAMQEKYAKKFRMRELQLQKFGERLYLDLDTVNYEKQLNAVQREFAEAFYGAEHEFIRNMVMFANRARNIRRDVTPTVRIYVINPALNTSSFMSCGVVKTGSDGAVDFCTYTEYSRTPHYKFEIDASFSDVEAKYQYEGLSLPKMIRTS